MSNIYLCRRIGRTASTLSQQPCQVFRPKSKLHDKDLLMSQMKEWLSKKTSKQK